MPGAIQVLVRECVLYTDSEVTLVPGGRIGGVAIVEELPLMLATHDLGSIARYNPAFMSRLRASAPCSIAACL